MLALVLAFAAWTALTAILLALLRRDYRRAGVASETAVLLWPWHGLNYVVLVLVGALGLWPMDLPSSAALAIGVALVVAGALAIAAGFKEFGSIRRLSGTRTDEVISAGIYRYSRHPQYLGIILTLFGAAVAGGSFAALAFATALGVGLLLYLPIEEEYAERSLGERYRRYRERTPRLLGFPRG